MILSSTIRSTQTPYLSARIHAAGHTNELIVFHFLGSHLSALPFLLQLVPEQQPNGQSAHLRTCYPLAVPQVRKRHTIHGWVVSPRSSHVSLCGLYAVACSTTPLGTTVCSRSTEQPSTKVRSHYTKPFLWSSIVSPDLGSVHATRSKPNGPLSTIICLPSTKSF